MTDATCSVSISSTMEVNITVQLLLSKQPHYLVSAHWALFHETPKALSGFHTGKKEKKIK